MQNYNYRRLEMLYNKLSKINLENESKIFDIVSLTNTLFSGNEFNALTAYDAMRFLNITEDDAISLFDCHSFIQDSNVFVLALLRRCLENKELSIDKIANILVEELEVKPIEV